VRRCTHPSLVKKVDRKPGRYARRIVFVAYRHGDKLLVAVAVPKRHGINSIRTDARDATRDTECLLIGQIAGNEPE
jgi:ACT domain-containing protein